MTANFELYKIFYVVATHLHMSNASEELFISQPAVSQSIKKLEAQLGGTLFLRSNKGLQLTAEGKMFYLYVKQAINSITNAENEFTNFKNLKTGEIKIGISATLTKLILLEPLKAFHNDYPDIKINISNELTKDLLFNLQRGLLDLVIFNEGDSYSENLMLKKIRSIEHCFICGRDFISIPKNNVDLMELNQYPLILQKKESNTRQFLDSFALLHKCILNPYLEVVSQGLVSELTKIGLGIGFAIKDFVLEELSNEILFEIQLKEQIPSTQILLATNKSINPTFAANKFIEYCGYS